MIDLPSWAERAAHVAAASQLVLLGVLCLFLVARFAIAIARGVGDGDEPRRRFLLGSLLVWAGLSFSTSLWSIVWIARALNVDSVLGQDAATLMSIPTQFSRMLMIIGAILHIDSIESNATPERIGRLSEKLIYASLLWWAFAIWMSTVVA